MTGMCGGRGDSEDDEGTAEVEVAGGRGHGDVLAGAGRSGGGDERVGEPSVDAGALEAMVFDPSSFPISSSFSVSLTADSGGSYAPVW